MTQRKWEKERKRSSRRKKQQQRTNEHDEKRQNTTYTHTRIDAYVRYTFFPVCCSMDRVNKRSTLCSCVAFIISPWDAQQRTSRSNEGALHTTEWKILTKRKQTRESKKKLFFFSFLYFENLHSAQQRHTALLLLLLTMVHSWSIHTTYAGTYYYHRSKKAKTIPIDTRPRALSLCLSFGPTSKTVFITDIIDISGAYMAMDMNGFSIKLKALYLLFLRLSFSFASVLFSRPLCASIRLG